MYLPPGSHPRGQRQYRSALGAVPWDSRGSVLAMHQLRQGRERVLFECSLPSVRHPMAGLLRASFSIAHPRMARNPPPFPWSPRG